MNSNRLPINENESSRAANDKNLESASAGNNMNAAAKVIKNETPEERERRVRDFGLLSDELIATEASYHVFSASGLLLANFMQNRKELSKKIRSVAKDFCIAGLDLTARSPLRQQSLVDFVKKETDPKKKAEKILDVFLSPEMDEYLQNMLFVGGFYKAISKEIIDHPSLDKNEQFMGDYKKAYPALTQEAFKNDKIEYPKEPLQALSSSTINHIQRLPRYQLLIRDLIKKMDANDTVNLEKGKKALAKIELFGEALDKAKNIPEKVAARFFELNRLIGEVKYNVLQKDLRQQLLVLSKLPYDKKIMITLKNMAIVEKNLENPNRNIDKKQKDQKKMEIYRKKFAAIQTTTNVALDFDAFKAEDISSLKTGISALEKEFNDKWGYAKEMSASNGLKGHYSATKTDLDFDKDIATMEETISRIKKNDYVIAKLTKMFNDLHNESTYGHKYKSYRNLKDEISQKLNEAKAEKEKNISLYKEQDVKTSYNYQLAIISAEREATDKILYGEKKLVDSLPRPILKAKSSQTFARILEDFSQKADSVNRALQVEQSISLPVLKNKLRNDIDKYGKPNKEVLKQYDDFIDHTQGELNKRHKEIVSMQKAIKVNYKAVAKTHNKTWYANNYKDPNNFPIKDQVESLKDACRMMIYLKETQNSLMPDHSFKKINLEAFQSLLNVLDQKNIFNDKIGDKFVKREWYTSELRTILKDFIKGQHKAQYNALPYHITWKLNALYATLSPSLFNRIANFFRPNAKVSSQQKADAPLEIHHDKWDVNERVEKRKSNKSGY